MGSVREGARQAIENCLKIKADEKLVIITDKKNLRIGSILRRTAKRITNNIQFFVMEDFGERPLAFSERIREAIEEADVSIYAAQGVKGELQTFRNPMIETVEANPKLRHGHMVDITPQIMKEGMCSDYQEVQRISRLVFEKVQRAAQIIVVTEKGTNLKVEFSPELRWDICDGDIKQGYWSNLPDGEVLTCPANVNGRVVIDGCLGDFFTEKYGSLGRTPVTIEIADGRAENIQCDNEKLQKELAEYIFGQDENSDRVGEFAIGTNVGLKKLIHNLLQDEKFPGVHIAFGSPYPAKTGASWDSKAHVDGIMIAPTVCVDGRMIMEKGKFLL